MTPKRLLMIGLDAADRDLIADWMSCGDLPHLQALSGRGALMPLESTADWLTGSPWPSFYTGTPPAHHGLYHYLVWRGSRMSTTRPAPSWMPLDPFWRGFSADRRVIAVDVPLTYQPVQFPGIEVLGWGSHELLVPPTIFPRSEAAWIRKRHGGPRRIDEEHGLLSLPSLLATRDELVETTKRVAALGADLLQNRPWDLALVCFGATHRGGHRLWDRSGTSATFANDLEDAHGRELDKALREIYRASDQAVGRLIAAAGDDTMVLVFSLHGMGTNTDRNPVLEEMLRHILGGQPNGGEGLAARPGAGDEQSHFEPPRLERFRQWIPSHWRHAVKRRLPLDFQDRLTIHWRFSSRDWRKTRAFSLFGDQQGYIRINLRGRERDGVVEPGAEYRALCRRIEAGLRDFVDADTGAPVVAAVGQQAEIFAAGNRRGDLPDLVVQWAPTSAAAHRALVSSRYGRIPWPTPGSHPSGRSGNHRPGGFVIGAGPGLQVCPRDDPAHILDLAPTAHRLLGLAVPTEMVGRPLFSHQVDR